MPRKCNLGIPIVRAWIVVNLTSYFFLSAILVWFFPSQVEPESFRRGRVVPLMKRVIDTSEVLGTVEQPEGPCELCASADAGFEDDSGLLEVRLEAYLRPAEFLAKERHFRTDWLPTNETVRESCRREESGEMARDIFHRWVRKVRESAPQLHHV